MLRDFLGVALSLGAGAPVFAALMLAVRRWWAGASLAQVTLGAAVLWPMVVIAQVHALGHLPWRPLDLLWVLHGVVVAGSIFVVLCARAQVAELLREIALRWRRASMAERGVATLLAAWLLVVLLAAVWNQRLEADALSYHVPQMVQPIVDGRLGPVEAPFIWADTFPRTANLLRAHFFATGAGWAAVNLTSWLAAVMMTLAAYVGGRAVGAGRLGSLAGSLVVCTAPIVIHLCTGGNVDLEAHAPVSAAGALALCALKRRRGAGATPLVLAYGGVILGAWVKFVTIGMGGAVWVFLVSAVAVLRRRGPVHAWGLGATALVLCAVPYVPVWLEHGSPLYPIELRLGSVTVFEGPIPTTEIALRHEHVVERMARTWFEWYTPLTTDSPGGLGPLFGLLAVPALLLITVHAVVLAVRRRFARVAMLALPMLSLLVSAGLPQQHLPRFGLGLAWAGAVALAWCIGRVVPRPVRAAAAVVVVGLAGFSAALWWRSFERDTLGPTIALAPAGSSLLGEERNRFMLDGMNEGPASATPLTRRFVRGLLRPGETLLTAVAGAPVLWMDAPVTFRVRHVPVGRWPAGFDAPEAAPEGDASEWLARVAGNPKVRAAVVYAGWPEDAALSLPGGPMVMVLEQPARGGARAIRVYARP
ncbi:MAG: hypothetical protein ACT4PL_08185 [Phycisphaerales bacterium]